MSDDSLRQKLDQVYHRYNRKKYLHPDPLEFLHGYDNLADREIVGFIAASLAYGRVKQILKSVSRILATMAPSPHRYVSNVSTRALKKDFSGFAHRFAKDIHIVAMILAIKQALTQYGNLNGCFLNGFSIEDDTVVPGLDRFIEALTHRGTYETGHLIPDPKRGSACKRLNLFLRWMIREDRVDPGGWQDVPASKLVIPLDTHMHRIGSFLGFTKRKQADLRTALEITDGFRRIRPDDPVRYDFALTRMGIRDELNLHQSLVEIFGLGSEN